MSNGKKVVTETRIFPRYHQLDVVRKLAADARATGSGKNYLIQHSAGSGKSNSIAWLAYRLSSLHNASDDRVFDSVIVITDRRVLDKQLQDGQGAFRVLVTDAYHKRCAATGEKTLPVLQAAHIKPYSYGGEHAITNGLLLRADLHILFDRGYLTITPDLRVEVSPRIKEAWTNGRDYYALHGSELKNLPEHAALRPSIELLQWHNENVYQQPLIQL